MRWLVPWSLLGGLAACSTLPPASEGAWPAGLPPRRYYESAWASDARNQGLQSCPQYLSWVESFYRGSVLVPGWTRRQVTLVGLLGPEESRLAEPELTRLGQLLSSEWAKDNRIRRISSEELAVWGGVLSEACRRGTAMAALDTIAADVRGLLDGRLDPDTVTRDRYLGASTSRP